jgi:hypothetical protein
VRLCRLSASDTKTKRKAPKKEEKKKQKQNQHDRDDRREASLESATINDSPLPASPITPSGLALLSPASVASVASSLRSSNCNKKGDLVVLKKIIIIIIIHQQTCFLWPVMN